jgi:hypothetical protein
MFLKRGNIATALLPTAAALMTHCRCHTAAMPTLHCRQAAANAAVPYVLLSLLSSFPSPLLLPLLVDC